MSAYQAFHESTYGTVIRSIRSPVDPHDPRIERKNLVLGWWLFAIALIVVPVVGASVFALFRFRPSYSVYLWGGLLIPLSFVFADRPLMSMPRFVLPLFPAFWALAQLTERRRIPQKAVAAVGAAGLGLLVVLFVNWYYIF